MRERVELFSGGTRVRRWLVDKDALVEYVDDPGGRFTGYVKFKKNGRYIVVCGTVVVTQEGKKECSESVESK